MKNKDISRSVSVAGPSSTTQIAKTRVSPELDVLADLIGDFIQYWGFKRIHGRIWTHLFLSDEPLDASELIRRLRVSKALMSFSLNDLLSHDVILEAGKGRRGTIFYQANPDLTSVIVNVLRTRERLMLEGIQTAFKLMKNGYRAGQIQEKLSEQRVHFLEEMIQSAERTLDLFISLDGDGQDLCQRFKIIASVFIDTAQRNMDPSGGS